MSGDDEVGIHVRLKDVTRFQADSKRAARSIDDIGDKAKKAARHMRQLSKSSATARIALGPLSFKAKTGVLAIGALSLGLQKATPTLLGFAEATGVVVGGAGAAGAVGLTALAQGFNVASLATKGLTDALGGNATALKGLEPQARKLFDTLHSKQQKLKGTAAASLFPGLDKGATRAIRNFGRVDAVTRRTGSALGGLASQAGGMLGSKAFGRDFSTVGNANVKIIRNLGQAGLSLANTARSILAEAAPLAVWLSELARSGASLLDNWIQQKRAGDDLTKFFARAKTDLRILGSITGNTGRGILNLFGAQDVDGTKTLRSLDRITSSFERWTRGVKGRHLGEAVADQIPKAGGLIAGALANTLALAVPQAARIFWHGFWDSDAAGKALIGSLLLKKAGAFGLLSAMVGNLFGGKDGKKGGLLGAITRKAPLPVVVMNKGFGGVPTPTKAKSTVAKRVLPKLAAGSVGGPEGVAAAVGVAALAEINHFGQSHGIDPPDAARRAPRGRNQQFHLTVETPVNLDGREIARAIRRLDMAELARNAQRIDRDFSGRAPGAGH